MSILDNNNETHEEFLTVCPRSEKYLDYNVKAIPLKVVRDVGVTPDVSVKVNRLNQGKQIVNTSGDEDRFKISVIINRNDTLTGDYHYEYTQMDIDLNDIVNMTGNTIEELQNDEFLNTVGYTTIDEGSVEIPVIYALDNWIKTAEPLYVVTDAIDIPNDYYVVISNGSRKQELHNNVVWDLEFIRFKEFFNTSFQNTNVNVQTAISNHNKETTKKQEEKKTKAKQTDSLKSKFKKCDYKKLKYSKTKKTSNCVKLMQKLLIKYNCLKDTKSNKDGWYGQVTVDAVKKFQRKYKDKYKLKETGKINKATFKALYTGGSTKVQIGKTIKLN